MPVRPNATEPYPNLHGDITATANAAGIKTGTFTYDPFGQQLSSTLPDNSIGNADYGWLGQHQKLTEHEPGTPTVIEMGARVYNPALGRFLQVDPIQGGTDNDYTYVGDPINQYDLTGTNKCEVGANPLRWMGNATDCASKVGDLNWGDLMGGGFNVVYGTYKIVHGLKFVLGAPACGVFAALCTAYGYYQIATGLNKVRKGIVQLQAGMKNCTSHCSTRNQLVHAGLDMLPFGNVIERLFGERRSGNKWLFNF